MVFLCGLLVGLLPLLGRPGLRGLGPDPDDLTGTLTSRRAGDRAAAVSRQVVAFGPVRGRVLVSRTSRGVIADLEMAATGEVDLVIEYDPRAYRLVGFEHTGEGAGEAEAGSGRVRVARFTTGWLRIALVDGAPPALPPLRLMASRGEESFEQAIEVHGDDR